MLIGMDSIIFFLVRQDRQDFQDIFFIFNNFRKKLMKFNPPSVETKNKKISKSCRSCLRIKE
ncbi:hypothetical protein D1AOALGA4SA_12301 [Olavius algarvensis Delta 1 endosymbiont]|nr:hypothetical protein D1AOALGA4SA_12301 [Olavius algarvensis Delta 1 endosymbiont]